MDHFGSYMLLPMIVGHGYHANCNAEFNIYTHILFIKQFIGQDYGIKNNDIS